MTRPSLDPPHPLPAATTSIDLSYTRVTDDGLAHLQRFEGLEELHITSTEITDAGIEQLMKLEKLRLIRADQSKISRKGQLKLITSPELDPTASMMTLIPMGEHTFRLDGEGYGEIGEPVVFTVDSSGKAVRYRMGARTAERVE